MNVTERMLETAKPLLRERMEGNMALLWRDFGNNRAELEDGFAVRLRELFGLAAAAQGSGRKGPVSFLHVAYLYSSLITGSHDFRLSLCDAGLHLDEAETAVYWPFKFMFAYIQKDMEDAEALIKRHAAIRGAPAFHYRELGYWYSKAYLLMSAPFVREIVKGALARAGDGPREALVFSEDFSVVFGGHMENTFEIYPEYKGPKEAEEGEAV